jgi:hypothetical protein
MSDFIEALKKLEPPTKIRIPNQNEWDICQDVYGDTLPSRFRVLITNMLGLGGAPFTIPTSVFSAAAAPFFGMSLAVGLLQSVGNAGYLINVGSLGETSMAIGGYPERLLVHEMAHVWQGYNGTLALSYVMESALNQCKGMIASGSFAGRSAAYAISNTTTSWEDFNAEQQAEIIDKWYMDDKMSKTSDKWKYINYHVRKGSNSGDLTDIEGIWKVTTNGKNYFYWFKDGGYCKWFYKLPTVLTNYAPVDGGGEYKINGSFAEIKWDSGSTEKWVLPLSEQSQQGTWFANSGGVFPIIATKNPSG